LSNIGDLSHWTLFIEIIVDGKLIHDVFALRHWGRTILRLQGAEDPADKGVHIFLLVLEKFKQGLDDLGPCLIFVYR
jgi:hypothetical protein